MAAWRSCARPTIFRSNCCRKVMSCLRRNPGHRCPTSVTGSHDDGQYGCICCSQLRGVHPGAEGPASSRNWGYARSSTRKSDPTLHRTWNVRFPSAIRHSHGNGTERPPLTRNRPYPGQSEARSFSIYVLLRIDTKCSVTE